MLHFRKLRAPYFLNWVSPDFAKNQLNFRKQQLWPSGYSSVSQKTRLYRTHRARQRENSEDYPDNAVRIPRSVEKEAQAALLEYFHTTRNLNFLEAENMSKNSPIFLSEILDRVRVDIGAEIGHSIARFLRYNPVNEFEPFFESLGLSPPEYVPLLPRHFVFLSDAPFFLENYYLLRGYGFERRNVGKIYREASEVFFFDVKVLVSKLRGYEELGIQQSSLVKFISSSPYLLIGDSNVNADFVEVLERMKSFGLGISCIEGNLLGGSSCNWSYMLGLLTLISNMGLEKEDLAGILLHHPDILFEDSGNRTLLLVGFLLKFGYTMVQISSVLSQFPDVNVGLFVSNLRRCFLCLNKIEMGSIEIGDFVRSHALLMGTCALMRASSLVTYLCVGKKRLRSYILQNPQELKNLVLGAKIKRLPRSEEAVAVKAIKSKFLLNLGFVEESKEMKKAQMAIRGKAVELQERFDLLMSYGLDWGEVCEMVKVSPQILNQKKNVIRTKINILVGELGYPISSLWVFPSFLNFTIERVKLRLSMYDWLKGQGTSHLALSTIVATSEREFVKKFVSRHPSGPRVWQELKKKKLF